MFHEVGDLPTLWPQCGDPDRIRIKLDGSRKSEVLPKKGKKKRVSFFDGGGGGLRLSLWTTGRDWKSFRGYKDEIGNNHLYR
jgi:hypothetical protein